VQNFSQDSPQLGTQAHKGNNGFKTH
jgi:hypothetical protein